MRVDLAVPQLAQARSIEGALAELIDPPVLAVTLFESAGEGHCVSAYFAGPPDLERLAAALDALLVDRAAVPALASLRVSEVPDENWVAISQAALPPVAAGRFTVHGSHDRARVAQGPHAIEIDAGEAFGTAHHATTLGCLMAIDRLTRRRQFRHVLDLGCGSGVLAIAAARALPRARVLASDLDPLAVAVARANVRTNRIRAGRLAVVLADALSHKALRTGRFDLIAANILAKPLIGLAPSMARATARGGAVVLSGVLVTQAGEVIAAYRAAGFRLAWHARLAGWSTLVLERR